MAEFARVKADCWTHPKFAGLSLEAKALWLRGLLYAAQHDTDTIPTEELANDSERALTIAGDLVLHDLWHPTDCGWQIHDYFDWNPRRPQDRRTELADAVRRGAGLDQADWGKRYADQITAAALESDITPGEVEAITRWLLEQWAAKSPPITGIPRFQTILTSRGQYQMARRRPINAATYLIRSISDDQDRVRRDSGPALHGLAEGGRPGPD